MLRLLLVAATCAHGSLVLTEFGTVLAWGDNTNGATGLGTAAGGVVELNNNSLASHTVTYGSGAYKVTSMCVGLSGAFSCAVVVVS
jgi:alpha-tubulin suppressor-like RCC1 family protein